MMKGLAQGTRAASAAAFLAAMGLLVAGIVLATYVDRNYQRQRDDDLKAQARILAATETAAVAFNDTRTAQEYLNALRANPLIVAAGIYARPGTLFASYPAQPPDILPRSLGTRLIPRHPGLIEIRAEIAQQGMKLGSLILLANAEPLATRIQRDGAIVLLLAMAALLVVVLGAAQAALRRANRALATHAEELAVANRTLESEIAQRAKVEEALRQSQKMEAIGQLTGGVAHDFNNLLQVVLGSLERVRFRAERIGLILPQEIERLIEAAQHGSRRAAVLTQQLLAFSRRQPLAPKPLEMNRLVAGMSEMLARTLGEAVQIETVLGGGLWRVLADANQLENALINLAVNARDAMQGGGRLTIETANAFLDEAYTRAEDDVQPGQYVMLAVTDTGSGMPPDVLRKVFEPFFTTKELGRGTGLGLSQVYGFIKQSGGHIRIYSEVGQGTTVKIYLPRLVAGPEEAAQATHTGEVPLGSEVECILVVEDEAAVRALTVATLRELKYRVVEAADGPAALAVLQQEPAVRLLFTDVGLPGGMNGRQLADAAREGRPALKVLFTTGYARNAIVHHGRIDPGVELISKPFSAADLAHRVRTILDRG